MALAAALLIMLGGGPLPSLPQKENSAEPAPRGVAIMCDPTEFRFSLRADSTAADLEKKYPVAKIVSVDDLFFRDGLPGWTGQIDILAPLVRYERCGPYTFKLEGAAYNVNVQGEAGAYDAFASLTILRGNGTIFPEDGGSLRLTACDRLLPRARPCPDGYAVRLDASYDRRHKALQIVQTTQSFEDEEATGEKTATRRFAVADDLETWHPD